MLTVYALTHDVPQEVLFSSGHICLWKVIRRSLIIQYNIPLIAQIFSITSRFWRAAPICVDKSGHQLVQVFGESSVFWIFFGVGDIGEGVVSAALALKPS